MMGPTRRRPSRRICQRPLDDYRPEVLDQAFTAGIAGSLDGVQTALESIDEAIRDVADLLARRELQA